jgi:hypothetical protein
MLGAPFQGLDRRMRSRALLSCCAVLAACDGGTDGASGMATVADFIVQTGPVTPR